MKIATATATTAQMLFNLHVMRSVDFAVFTLTRIQNIFSDVFLSGKSGSLLRLCHSPDCANRGKKKVLKGTKKTRAALVHASASVWPEKNCQISIKVAQKWFHLKNDRFWHHYKNCLRMWKIWANQLLLKALKSCPKSNKLTNLVTLIGSRHIISITIW